ncbi:hypothetical protein Moror_11834, partial [Moniliophthora roreri MCA 2997]
VQWVNLYLKDIQDITNTFKWLEDNHCLHSHAIRCLIEFHNLLEMMSAVKNRNVLAAHIYSCLGNIEFVLDWKQMGHKQGGRAKQGLFYHYVFLTHISVKHWDMSDEWYNQNSNIVTGCYHLLTIYQNFGVGILLDLFWDINHIYNNATSPLFSATLKELAS